MTKKQTIYDEINLNINPYSELKITPVSNEETIKEAYKLLKNSLSPDKKMTVDIAYDMIKNKELRARFNILRNRPLETLDEIKKYGYKPKKLETKEWISIIES